MKSKTKLKSNCCNASIKVGEENRVTMYYVCTKCDKPCDVHVNTRKTWTINPKTRIVKNKKPEYEEKLTRKEIENFRKNEDF